MQIEIDEKLIKEFLESDKKLDERSDSYDQNKKYEGFLDIRFDKYINGNHNIEETS